MVRILIALLILLPASLSAGVYQLADQGYQARANGMDLDDDFIYGEVGVDDLACDDSNGDGATIVSEDIDGDSKSEQQIYVIPATGTDDADCGGPNNTDGCATVMYAYNNRLNSDADATTEDYICLVGTAHEALALTAVDGVSGYKSRPALGNEIYVFQYPKDPNVIMGADRDDDGSYPPYDTDDTAVFDGWDGATSYHDVFLTVDSATGTDGMDNWEFAHFDVIEYGIDHANRAVDNETGAFHAGRLTANSPDVSDHHYYHDIEMDGIEQGGEALSTHNFFYELWDRQMQWHALENITCIDCCGYGMRGSGLPGTKEYLRVGNTTWTWDCEDNDLEKIDTSPGTPAIKMWGEYSYIEILNNDWDASIAGFDPDNSIGYDGGGITVNTCVRDFYAIGNLFKNFPAGFENQGGDTSGCTTRNSDNLYLINNEFVYTTGIRSSTGININSGGTQDNGVYTCDIYAYNNIFRDAHATLPNLNVGIHINSDGSSNAPGCLVLIANNTFFGREWGWADTYAAVSFTLGNLSYYHDYIIKDNIFQGGTATDFFIRWWVTGGPTTTLDMDYNIYPNVDADREFWGPDGTRYDTLALFSAATGFEANSKGIGQNPCTVDFATEYSDLHIAAEDTCAKDSALSLASYFTYDFDGDTRSGTWDIGMDEIVSGASAGLIMEGLTVSGVTKD